MFRKDYLNQPYVKKNIYCKSEMSDRRVKDTQSFLRLEKTLLVLSRLYLVEKSLDKIFDKWSENESQ